MEIDSVVTVLHDMICRYLTCAENLQQTEDN